MKKTNGKLRLIALTLAMLLLPLSLLSCGKENKYVKIGVYNTPDGLCTYLTGKAQGLIKVSNYVYFSDGIEDTLGKLTAEKMGIDVAYITVDDLQYLTADLPVTVIMVDNYRDGEVHGLWVANTDWLANTPTYSLRFIDNLCSVADYCALNKSGTYAESRAQMDGVKDFDFADYTNPLDYVAMFAAQNDLSMEEVSFDYTQTLDNLTQAYEKCAAAYEKVKDVPQIKSFEDMFTLTLVTEALTASGRLSE